MQSELQDGLHPPLKPVQLWGSCSMSLFDPFSPSLVLKPHFTSAKPLTFLPVILVPKASPRHLGLLHRHSVPHSPQPRPSPLEGLSAAPVHLEAAGAEGGVQERCAVDLGAPGHIEDPCTGKAVVSRVSFPTSCPWDFLGPEPQSPALPWGQLQSQGSAGTHLPHRHLAGTHRHLCRVPGAQAGRSRSSAVGPWKLQGYRRAQGQDTTGLSAQVQHLWLSLLTSLPLLGGQRDGRCPLDH